MSMSVDVLMFDWKSVVDQIVDNGCNNRYVVEEVLQMYGEKICDKYVILLDDHQLEDPMRRVCHAIERLFGIEDCFGIMYDTGFDYICSGFQGHYYGSDNALEKLAELLESEKVIT